MSAKKGFSDILLGMSFAATWTWAAAMLVGISIMKEAGIIPFILWFIANTSAIPVFGWISRKYPGLWAQTRRAPMRILMTVMLVFTLWFNMTGIQSSGVTTGWFTDSSQVMLKIIPMLVLFLVWIATFKSGIRWSVISDRFQWVLELGSVFLIVIVTLVELGGFHVQPGLKLGSYDNFRGWILGLWTVPLLLSNPFLDGTFWHRAAYAKSMKPYWYGYGMFLVYLLGVAVIALVGLSPSANIVLFAVIFFASFSTLDSCTAGLQLTATKKVGNAIGFLSIFGWLIISNMKLLDAWSAMFVWYPLLFGIQVVTYWLEKTGLMKPVSEHALAARDALPLITDDKVTYDKGQEGGFVATEPVFEHKK